MAGRGARGRAGGAAPAGARPGRWDAAQDRALREGTGRAGAAEIAAALGRSEASVRARQRALGLLATPEQRRWARHGLGLRAVWRGSACIEEFWEGCAGALEGPPPGGAAAAAEAAARVHASRPLVFLPDFVGDYMRGASPSEMAARHGLGRHGGFASVCGALGLPPLRAAARGARAAAACAEMERQMGLVRPQLLGLLACGMLRAAVARVLLAGGPVPEGALGSRAAAECRRMAASVPRLGGAEKLAAVERCAASGLGARARAIAAGLERASLAARGGGRVAASAAHADVRGAVSRIISGAPGGVAYESLLSRAARALPLLAVADDWGPVDRALDAMARDGELAAWDPPGAVRGAATRLVAVEGYGRRAGARAAG